MTADTQVPRLAPLDNTFGLAAGSQVELLSDGYAVPTDPLSTPSPKLAS